MIASHILIQAEAGPVAVVTAARQEVPGVPGTASVVGRCDFIAGTRDAGELARPVISRARASGAGTRTMSRPAVHQ